ncbi:MAG: hypothetical protein PHT07_16720 [Paludibacter sp.]|nr:hypothetical protein [Paludibacter sp.]
MNVHYLPPSYKSSRPIKDFITQFIIVFLAVTLALYADRYRESYAEKAKAKEIAQSVYNDLKTDQNGIQQTINDKTWIEVKYDSLVKILATKDIREFNEYIYYVERYVSKSPVFESRNINFEQFIPTDKNRNIENTKLKKDIAEYNSLYDQYLTSEKSFTTSDISGLNEIESDLFNPRDLTSLDNPNAKDFRTLVLIPGQELQPIRRDVVYLKLLYIKVENASKHTKSMKQLLEKQKLLGLNLMKDLEKQYDLK